MQGFTHEVAVQAPRGLHRRIRELLTHAFVVSCGGADRAPLTVQARVLAHVRTLRACGVFR